jgi:hypothetical protein
MNSRSPEHYDALLRFVIGIVFAVTVLAMVLLSLYSIIFVVQPMSGIAPADKQFFFLLSDMSKYILGSLATLLAIKGKDKVQEISERLSGGDGTPTPPASAIVPVAASAALAGAVAAPRIDDESPAPAPRTEENGDALK